MALTLIQQVRLNIQDNDPSFPILTDDEIQYLLDKNNLNVDRASIDAARIVLFKLAQQGDETVDIFSLKGSKAAEAYRLALELYINNPSLNPLGRDITIYAGGISREDMLKNDLNPDNNLVQKPSQDRRTEFVTFDPWPRIVGIIK